MKQASVFLDGKFVGFVDNGHKLVDELRKMRRGGGLNNGVNAAYFHKTNEVFVNSDEGRARRPLLVVKQGKPLLTAELSEKLKNGEMHWKDLLEKGIVEFLDAEEEENAFVALNTETLTSEHTHLEIDPLMILGFASS
ncbi:MAG TPA: hypothetical protein VJI71_03465, partial [Candidatus Norongarragalinales archaeon]|nr:hypothetical protein [Candidatus Norongarragalinales archaeon]